MSASLSVLSSLASSAAVSTVVVAAPAAGLALANSSQSLPAGAKEALIVVAGITYIAVFLSHLGKALPVLRALCGTPSPASAPAPAPTAPPLQHLVTHAELEARLERIEDKMDRSAATSRKELAALTSTMQACFHDMAKSIGKLEGQHKAM